MLRSLELVDVGPSPHLKIDLGPQLNVFAGDNGLGKSFVLEVLWWALTGVWAELPAWPRPGETSAAEIALEIDRSLGEATFGRLVSPDNVNVLDDTFRIHSRFDLSRQRWNDFPLHTSRAPLPALVLFARADGSFAVWDPARNHWALRPHGLIGPTEAVTDASFSILRRPPAVFEPKDVWNGLEDHGKTLCNGLIRDWVSWQQKTQPAGNGEGEFDLLRRTLATLSPHVEHPNEIIRPGLPVRLFIDDTRDFPTVDFGYGDVPVIHLSAGMRRILALAYLVVWSWREHVGASKLLRRPPVEQVVFLMDEVENHLHPAWQRQIIKALLTVLEGLSPGMKVQACLTTHAPLVLASLEPIFDPERDRFFVFDLDGERRTVALDEVPWVKQGDATDWLTSPAFKLREARSVEAERVIEDAEAFMRGDEPALYKTRAAIDAELHRVLAGDDVFWPRWLGSGGEAHP